MTSVSFIEHEGSFLVGMVAAMTTRTNKIGFIGGADFPLIHKFEVGFTQGAKYVNPGIEVFTDYANNFGDAGLGRTITKKQMKIGVDFIYPAAGYTGFGALQAAQDANVWGAGVDSDQFFIAEKAVVTSMLKNIDVAVYNITKELLETGTLSQSVYELGLIENGVALAPIRAHELLPEEVNLIESAREKIISGSLTVQSTK